VDLAIVDALARAVLNARRAGARVRVVNASPELRELIAFAGLEDVLLGRDGRQAEERKQPLGVEERREPDDPPL
jgi:anti-anti-sigma regulatory factor